MMFVAPPRQDAKSKINIYLNAPLDLLTWGRYFPLAQSFTTHWMKNIQKKWFYKRIAYSYKWVLQLSTLYTISTQRTLFSELWTLYNVYYILTPK